MLRALIFAMSLIAGAGAALAWTQKDGVAGAPACPDRLAAGTDALLCSCPAEATATGSVWGADPYTDDSAICRAALHAGAIGTGGGLVQVYEAPGQDDYPAVTRNSVASGHWGEWRRSISFRSGGDAREPQAAACPANAAGMPIGARLGCTCAPDAADAGPVWGSGPYTADSSICRAARHAGAIRDYGEVRLRVVPGLGAYPASRRGGVDSGAWGSYDRAIAFED